MSGNQKAFDWFDACIALQPAYQYAVTAPFAGINLLPVPTTLYFTRKIARAIAKGRVFEFDRSRGKYILKET